MIYRQKILGKGSFGKVMLVEHKEKSIFYKHPKSLEQLYAMKVLLKGSIKTER
jgi:serine/threonine protein kinase